MGYAGSYVGLFTIYILPIALHLKRTYLEVANPVLLKMLEQGIILSYDDVNKYTKYFENEKLVIMKGKLPENQELRESLIEPYPIGTIGLSQKVEIDSEGRDSHYDLSCKIYADKLTTDELEHKMKLIFAEFQKEIQYKKLPGYSKLIISGTIDMLALAYGLLIFVIQFLEF